jgi:hypothetical protein
MGREAAWLRLCAIVRAVASVRGVVVSEASATLR